MTIKITRRSLIKVVAGAVSALWGAGSAWRIAIGGRVVEAQTLVAATWQPIFFSEAEGHQLAALCEAIIPRTNTPGARDARVHEYIDLAISAESDASKRQFREGLAWMDAYCQRLSRKSLAQATGEEISIVLANVSDANESISEELKPGSEFFLNLKTRTVFGYYTSREGWVEELGRPEHIGMEKWVGCAHPNYEH